MNLLVITGNLTRDPEPGTTPAGKSYCRFTVAVNRYAGLGKEETDFFSCTAWDKAGDQVATQKKGNKVAVTGECRLREYTDNSGVKHKTVDVVANRVEFLSPKQEPKGSERLVPYDDDGGDLPF